MTEVMNVRGREILDSRGNPTVEADVYLASGVVGRAAVPSVLRQASSKLSSSGTMRRKGVQRAVGHINGQIAQEVKGFDAADPIGLDRKMIALDGTPNKGRLRTMITECISPESTRFRRAS